MENSLGKKGRIKTRELTKNEKVLLSLLGIVIVSWLVYRFIITPQNDKLQTLNAQKIEYQAKIDEMNDVLRRESHINEEWDTLHKEKEQIVSQYFPKLDQAQIIYLLNELVANEKVDVVDLNFNRPSYEDIGGFQVKNMDISIPYNGSYSGVMDLITALKNSPRKILVESLSMDRDNKEALNGNMSLRIYSLEGIADSDADVIYIDTVTDGVKPTPFLAYNDFTGDQVNVDGSETSEEVQINPYIEEILLDFENRNNYFLPSQELVKGSVGLSTNSKSKKHSLRFEYNIVAIEEENRAFIDVTRNNILLKYPPNSIGLWIFSYDYSPATLGVAFRGQMGEDVLLPLTEGIGWTGWKYIEASPPSDLSIYPLKLERLYIDMPKDREDFGVILMDKLEAVYTRNLGEDGSDKSISDYIFHVVELDDTIEKISLKYYGNKNYKNEILKLNEIKSNEVLPVGKVLVLKKR